MEKITLSNYNILIDNNFINYDVFFDEVNKLDKVFVVTDENVYNLYKDKFENKTNRTIIWYILKPGDISKNEINTFNIISFLMKNEFKKDDLLISFGGGMITDITGFVASIYLRGVSVIHIPTTLLSQVDSSVGSKTGINYNNHKNMIGSFYNPKLVLIETEYLKTLSKEELLSGYGEIIKAGFLGDEEILNIINKNDSIDLINKAILVKKQFVERDYYDKEIRHALNFGHTFGHALESASNYTISHGKAITWGMIKSLQIGIKLKITNPKLLEQLNIIIKKLDFNIDEKTNYNYKPYLINDKKSDKKGVKFVVLKDFLKPHIVYLTWKEINELDN